MKFFAIAILLISAEGSYGVMRSGSTITSSNATLSNQTEESNAGRTKRYIEHFNPLFKHMDFLKKDGKFFKKYPCSVEYSVYVIQYSISTGTVY